MQGNDQVRNSQCDLGRGLVRMGTFGLGEWLRQRPLGGMVGVGPPGKELME